MCVQCLPTYYSYSGALFMRVERYQRIPVMRSKDLHIKIV